MNDGVFKGLNKQQIAAVSYINGPSVILAGAGSGKTRVLIHKVMNLIINHKIDPVSILMITFTNKAAGEMKKRINLQQKENLGYVGTFHSLCAWIIRRESVAIGIDRNFVIYDEDSFHFDSMKYFTDILGMNVIGTTYAIHGDPETKKTELIEIGKKLFK